MELRVLRYFVTVAREENITRAAEILHITQPTLSRQLMQLEDEFDTPLFIRGKNKITLTEKGMLLRRRAEDLLELADKTEKEMLSQDQVVSGEIYIGAGETKNMQILAKAMSQFHQLYPQVHYHIHSGAADDIKEKIDKGLMDFGLLIEPVDIEKYDFLRLNPKEVWGLLMRKDYPLASQTEITPEDLKNIPLIVSERTIVQNEIAHWFGQSLEQLNIISTYNLIYNAMILVEEGLGCVVCVDKLVRNYDSNAVCFKPFSPKLETGTVLVWKKHQIFSQATSLFLDMVKQK